jgi:adenosylmethionine-8-amino-7-oxononanoate aminotransferase
VHNIQPLLNKQYLKASAAKGVYITDENGKQYLDGSSGAVTSSLGHSHPKVLAAMHRQMDKLQFVYRSQFGSNEAEELADRLFALSMQQRHTRTFFVNSGSEAIETAMKTALQYWQEIGQLEKTRFISRWKSYHGITTGALSLSGHPLRRKRFEKTLEKYPALHYDLEATTVEEQMNELVSVIEKSGAHTIAAFVAEPIVGAAGTALTPHDGYYQAARRVCDQFGILFIADEVMTGLGRTGKWFGMEHWDTIADIVAVGKSLGAGYAPIAATLMTEAVYEPIRAGSGLIMSGHTYSANPLSCAAASAVLTVVAEDALLENTLQKGAYIKEHLMALGREFPFITTVRGKGLLMGIEFDPGVPGLQAKCIDQCFALGLLVYPSAGGPHGRDENGILVAPPLIINSGETDELLDKLGSALRLIV